MRTAKKGWLRYISLCVILTLCLTVMGGIAAAEGETLTVKEVVKICRPSVVQVITSADAWDAASRETVQQIVGYGSGSYIRKLAGGEGGYILTNYHVVENGDSFQVLWYNPETKDYDLYMDAELVGFDNGTDIAILKFAEPAPEGAELLNIGDSDALELGDTAIVIGHPGATTTDYKKTAMYGSVTQGIVSGLQRSGVNAGNFSRVVSLIQVDAAINAGNSGGALLNDRAELVGIPTLKYVATGTDNMAFCVPVNSIKDYIDEIIETGKVIRPRIGVTVSSVDGPEEHLRSYPPMGAMIHTVEADSPAEEAGLLMYDIITEVNGVRVYNSDDLTTEFDHYQAGDVVTLKVYRYYDQLGAFLDKYEMLEIEVELKILD